MIKIAAVSCVNEIGKPYVNLKHYDSIVGRITEAHGHVDLVLFPEMCLMGFWHNKESAEMCVEVPGELTERVCNLAGKHNCMLAMGIGEADGDKRYITHFLASPDGYVGKYRKIYSYPTGNGMGQWFDGGEDFPVFDIDEVKVGINICWDNMFPENAQALARQGAEVLLSPFAIATKAGAAAEEWCNKQTAYLMGTAIFTGMHVIGCNHCGEVVAPNGDLIYHPGGIFFITPNNSGEVLFRSSGEQTADDFQVFTIDKSDIKKAKERYDYKSKVFDETLYHKG